jgi:hypothetical protein
MPPGGALIFELYRTPAGEDRVRLTFAYETLDQLRHASAREGGIVLSPVRLPGCDGGACSVPLAQLAQRAHALAAMGFVERAWTPASDAPVPAVDPRWMACAP